MTLNLEGREAEPFYTHAQPCGACGKPCESLKPCPWDSDLMVGPCCEIHSDDLPEERPNCDTLYQMVCRANTVQQVCDAFDSHRRSGCPICSPHKKIQKAQPEQEKRAA